MRAHEHCVSRSYSKKKESRSTEIDWDRPYVKWILSAWHRRNCWYHPDYDRDRAYAIYLRFKPVVQGFLNQRFSKRFDILKSLGPEIDRVDEDVLEPKTILDRYNDIIRVRKQLL